MCPDVVLPIDSNRHLATGREDVDYESTVLSDGSGFTFLALVAKVLAGFFA